MCFISIARNYPMRERELIIQTSINCDMLPLATITKYIMIVCFELDVFFRFFDFFNTQDASSKFILFSDNPNNLRSYFF